MWIEIVLLLLGAVSALCAALIMKFSNNPFHKEGAVYLFGLTAVLVSAAYIVAAFC